MMPQIIKMGLGGTGYLGKQESYQRAKRRRAARRAVKPGFPVTAAFKTREQVAEYFSGEKITCLLCGRMMRRLGVHLQRIHGRTEEWYKKEYGLPWRRGLSSRASFELNSTVRKELLKDPENRKALLERAEEAREAMKINPPKYRPPAEFITSERLANIYGYNSIPEFTHEHAEEYLARILQNRTPREVALDKDMPGQSWWFKYRRENPEYATRFWAAWDALPFEVQARGEMLGERFECELRVLYEAGLSDHEAADRLGVTAMTCNRRTKKWRAA